MPERKHSFLKEVFPYVNTRNVYHQNETDLIHIDFGFCLILKLFSAFFFSLVFGVDSILHKMRWPFILLSSEAQLKTLGTYWSFDGLQWAKQTVQCFSLYIRWCRCIAELLTAFNVISNYRKYAILDKECKESLSKQNYKLAFIYFVVSEKNLSRQYYSCHTRKHICGKNLISKCKYFFILIIL